MHKIALLSGDGIGAEVMAEALKGLHALQEVAGMGQALLNSISYVMILKFCVLVS